MARIVVLSDIHLSTHGFFWENWCVVLSGYSATVQG